MPSGERKDPFKNFRFLVEIDGITQAGFREVTIPDTAQDPIEYREGNELMIKLWWNKKKKLVNRSMTIGVSYEIRTKILPDDTEEIHITREPLDE